MTNEFIKSVRKIEKKKKLNPSLYLGRPLIIVEINNHLSVKLDMSIASKFSLFK